MSRLRGAFWNAREARLRALWRLLIYLALVAVLANPLILLLDATDDGLIALGAIALSLFLAIGWLRHRRSAVLQLGWADAPQSPP